MTTMSKNDTEKQQIIIFKLDEKLFGVDIGQIREITRVNEISPVPNAPSYIKGVTNLRGQVTTVIDLRKKLEIQAKEFDKSTRMMVIESKGTPKGMIVDCVAEVTMIPKADIEETPEITKIMDGTSAYIKGIGKKDNRLIILVDLKKLSTEGSDNVELEVNLEALETKTAPMPVSSAKARKKA
jgi:purine-binding chemotaxis protein CheW